MFSARERANSLVAAGPNPRFWPMATRPPIPSASAAAIFWPRLGSSGSVSAAVSAAGPRWMPVLARPCLTPPSEIMRIA